MKVKCKNCSKISSLELDIEVVSSNERQMGLEVFYDGTYCGECSNCGQEISIKAEYAEYPIDAGMALFNLTIDGAENMGE